MTKIKADGSLQTAMVDYCYQHGENYLIESSPVKDSLTKPICAIYFTSAGAYMPATVDGFCSKIVKINRYEMFGTRYKKASKHIYVRDILFKWYQRGINGEINSLEKLEDFLREETKGYEVVCLGISMGGYAALYFALKLHAESSITFSPYLDIRGICDIAEAPNLFELYKQDPSVKAYAYFADGHSDDVAQLELARKLENFHLLIGRTKQHGVSFPREVVERMINAEGEELKRVYDGALVKSPAEKFSKIKRRADKNARGLIVKLWDVKTKLEYKLCKHFKKQLERAGVCV